MATIHFTADHAAKAIGFTINSIDTLVRVSEPVYRAGQRAGRHCKPLIAAAWAQIDWQEVARIVMLGLVICAIGLWRFLRWAHPTLLRCSQQLGTWYARCVVDRESSVRDPQPILPIAANPQAAVAPEPPALEPPAFEPPAPEVAARKPSRRKASTSKPSTSKPSSRRRHTAAA